MVKLLKLLFIIIILSNLIVCYDYSYRQSNQNVTTINLLYRLKYQDASSLSFRIFEEPERKRSLDEFAVLIFDNKLRVTSVFCEHEYRELLGRGWKIDCKIPTLLIEPIFRHYEYSYIVLRPEDYSLEVAFIEQDISAYHFKELDIKFKAKPGRFYKLKYDIKDIKYKIRNPESGNPNITVIDYTSLIISNRPLFTSINSAYDNEKGFQHYDCFLVKFFYYTGYNLY